MMKFGKAAIVSGVVSVAIAALGVMLLISQPAKSKDTRTASGDGVITTLGF
jgi:hypothetical protein